MATRSAQRTKRTKTFTGCWTCRERKIKCDEAEPHCLQCRRKGLSCEGYSTRLQWLPPVLARALDADACFDEADQTSSSSLRRVLPAEPCRDVLPPRQLDDILRSIDAYDPSELSDENMIYKVKNFSVLRCTPAKRPFEPQEPRSQHRAGSSPSCSDAPTLRAADGDVPGAQIDVSSLLYPMNASNSLTGGAAHTQAILDGDLQHADHIETSPSENQDLASPAELGCDDFLAPLVADAAEDAQHERPTSNPQGTSSPSYDWLHPRSIPTNDLSLCSAAEMDRFLMRHYMKRVCHLFCAIDTSKSPWKTIHLPRALQAIAELGITGETTRVRNALLNALLSISAWYLSNDHRRHDANEIADQWAELAAARGFDAISLLKQAVDIDLYYVPRPKYKEFLATMLSMITVNVMSGDTTTCGVHLDGAHQLLSHVWHKKRKASEKMKILHRIYCYLRIIWESTQVSDDSHTRFALRSTTESVFRMLDQREASDILPDHPPRPPHEPLPLTSYEYIYGIPQNLLVMLEDTIKLIDRLARAKNSPNPADDLDAACDDLEQSILDWPIPRNTELWSPINGGPHARIVYHQTVSFHSALIIFFTQKVRSLNYRYLQKHVETVLESIEAIEKIKAETNMLAAPLFWPAFIAATTTFDCNHQARFRKWYGEADSYGIAAVRTGIRVILEVWKAGPPRSSARMCPWRHIVSHNSESLMLS